MPLRNLNQSFGGKRILGTPKTGVLASLIPTISGGGYCANDVTLPADAAKEICGRITTWPSAGTLFAYEDTSFTFSAPDGFYTFTYELYVDGVYVGSATVSLLIGAGIHPSTATLVADSASLQGSMSRADPVLTITQADINAIVNAVLAALNATTIPVNIKQFNDNPIAGTGRPGDPVTAT